MDIISKRILSYAVSHGIIRDEQYEEYVYILTMLLNIFATDITLLLIGVLMNMTWECIAFWLVYMLLRKYCGGLHFSTSLRCYLSSCIMCPIVLLFIRFMPFNAAILTAITILAAIALFILSPVEAENKPLDEKETAVFGKAARLLTAAVVIMYSIMVFAKLFTAAKIISLAIICVTIFAVAGKLHLKRCRNGV